MRSWHIRSRVTGHCVISNFASPASTRPTSHTVRVTHALQSSRFFSLSQSFSRLSVSTRYRSRFSSHPTATSRPFLPTNQHHHDPTVLTKEPILCRNMSSDNSYLAFLNKANEDLNAGRVAPQQSNAVRTQSVDVDVTVPAPLRAIDTYYVSETDEPFEPVVLKWEGASRGLWPGASQFSYLISPSKDLTDSITTLSPSAFDPKNQYVAVLRAVRAAATQASGGGEKVIDESSVDVKVYRVEIGASRVEYWIVALDVEGGKLVGLKAKAIES